MLGWGFSMRLLMTTILMAWLAQGNVFADGMVDPTKPPASVMEFLPNTQAEAEKPWELTAIQENGKSGFAVVNGQMVQVGGSYEGFKLTSVKNRQAVFVSKRGEKKVVGMGLASFIEQASPQASVKKSKSASKLRNQKVKK